MRVKVLSASTDPFLLKAHHCEKIQVKYGQTVLSLTAYSLSGFGAKTSGDEGHTQVQTPILTQSLK